MKALSIRQPWAWMIVHGWKDIENRDWSTSVRGRVFVHASKGMTREEYLDAEWVARGLRAGDVAGLPPFDAIERGGIVGSVQLVDCTTRSASPWFFGLYGFVLRSPEVLPFRAFRGQLGFFDVSSVEGTEPEGGRT